MAERDFSEIARLSERYSKNPTSRIFVQLGDAYRKNKMIDEAIDVLNKGLEHHPHYALAHLILGKCYFDQRSFARAKESFEKTLSCDPQNIVAYRMLAQTCESMKDEEGQISAYKGILAIDPLDVAAKEKLDRLASMQRKEPIFTVSMAQEYENQGNITKALSIYEQLLFTDPTDLLLQRKVRELKRSIEEEKKTEKSDTPIEPVFPQSGKREETIPPPPEVYAPDEKEEELAQKEEPLSLNELLTGETPEISQELESAATPEAAEPEPTEPVQEVTLEPIEQGNILQPIETHEPTQPSEFETEKEEQPTEPEGKIEIVQPIEILEELPEEEKSFESMGTQELSTTEPTTEKTDILQPTEELEEAVLPEPHGEKEEPEPEVAEESVKETPEHPETVAEMNEEKKEPTKPKEEDFQSFKDWLSGLLK